MEHKKNAPFVIERTFRATADVVWKAITDKEQMKQWYFDIKEFKPVVGFEFQFTGRGEDNETEYIHLCRILEVIPGRKLSYSWSYKDYVGKTIVTFDLFPEGNTTRLKLTHEGLETLPSDIPDFRPECFARGWTDLLEVYLKNFVENVPA
jgi:uncharacterized protein YndB with AHSA1/START domain